MTHGRSHQCLEMGSNLHNLIIWGPVVSKTWHDLYSATRYAMPGCFIRNLRKSILESSKIRMSSVLLWLFQCWLCQEVDEKSERMSEIGSEWWISSKVWRTVGVSFSRSACPEKGFPAADWPPLFRQSLDAGDCEVIFKIFCSCYLHSLVTLSLHTLVRCSILYVWIR